MAMGSARIIAGIMLGAASLSAPARTSAQAAEPLIVTRMADPDPNFVPPAAERPDGRWARSGTLGDESQIDVAMQNLGRAIGAAALADQQQIAAKCRQGQPQNVPPEQRFAWAASCRYSRH